MYLFLVLLVSFILISSLLFVYKSDSWESMIVWLAAVAILIITGVIDDMKNENELVKDLIKDKKIEWRINNKTGDSYLFLLDSTLINTYKRIK